MSEYWAYTHRIMEWADGGTPNMILDDGGDATMLVTLGSKAEHDASVLNNPESEEESVLFSNSRTPQAATRLVLEDSSKYPWRNGRNHYRRTSPVPHGKFRRAPVSSH